MLTNVFITIDTEHSIGGALKGQGLLPLGNEKRIYGKIKNKFYGIPLMMDIADNYGLKLVFFLEVFNYHYFGKSETREVCEYILKRNHEVQLHIHPVYLNFTLPDPSEKNFSDFIGSYSLSTQVEFLEKGRDLLKEYGAPTPHAFRAGNFGANLDTLKALSKAGFKIDTSYNPSYIGDCCFLPEITDNDVKLWHGIYEYPITGFQEISYIRSRRKMALDINGVNFSEIRWMLLNAFSIGLHNVTIIVHSFNFIKSNDIQYRKMTPRNMVIRRFEQLCSFLAMYSKFFLVKTFNDASYNIDRQSTHAPLLPEMPSLLSIRRLCEQAFDRV